MTRGLLLLALLELAAFAPFSLSIGFYHDDWVLLEALSGARSWAELARALPHWTRPLDLVFFPLAYAVGGNSPLAHHLLRMALELLAGSLFYLLLRQLLRSEGTALAAAALALIFPNRDAIHFWLSIAPETAAFGLVFAALLAHERWRRTGAAGWRVAGAVAYLASLLLYEAAVFMPLATAAAGLAEARREGVPWRKALRGESAGHWPFAAALALGVLWQRIGAPALFHIELQKSIVLSPRHALRTFGAGFECVTNRVLHICWLSLRGSARDLPWPLTPLAAGASAFAVFRLWDRLGDAGAGRTAGLALAVFIAAYLPYAVSGAYLPQIFGVMSRTNSGGAWAGGLLLAAGLAWLARRSRRAAGSALGLLLAAFIATDLCRATRWAEAWRVQKDVLGRVTAAATALPEGSIVLLSGTPKEVDHALVFDASWDFDSALRLASGRPDLRGDLAPPDLARDPDGVTVRRGAQPPRRYAYGRLYRYRYPDGPIERLGLR